MFKHDLLLTTALLAVAALWSSAARSGESARSFLAKVTAGPCRDLNDEFLCQYGGFAVSAAYGGGVGGSVHLWTHVAFPIVGAGKTVRRIKVKEEQAPYTHSPDFSAGIYSNGPGGFPGILIASGTGEAPETYGTVTIDIPPTTLTRNKRYWVVEEVGYPPYDNINRVLWSHRGTKHKAYVQKYERSQGQGQSNSSTTLWTKQWTGVYVQLR